MTVYVDDMQAPWRPPHMKHRLWSMSHLFADTVEELHVFAKKIGLRRSWFQEPPKASWCHYDVTAAKRREALDNGAVPIKYRDLPKKLREIGIR